jgi:hypothetical protein
LLEDAKERGATIEACPEITLMHSDVFREKFAVAMYVPILHATPNKKSMTHNYHLDLIS